MVNETRPVQAGRGWPIGRASALGFGLASALLLITAALAYQSMRGVADNERLVAQTHRVLHALEEALSALKDAETAQRGYLITADPAYLVPFDEQAVGDSIKRLEEITANDPKQQARVADLRQKVSAWMKVLKKGKRVVDQEGFEAARLFTLQGHGKQEMDDIRTLVAQMDKEEDEQLHQRTEDSDRSFTMALVTLILATGAGISLIGTAAYFISRDLAGRARAAERLYVERERFRVTLSSIGDGVIVTDAKAQVTFLNPVAESLTGWSQDAVGKSLAEVFRIVNEQTRRGLENPAARVLRTASASETAAPGLLLARDGREVAVAHGEAPIRDEAGKVTGVILVFRDITAQQQSERRRTARLAVTQILAEAAGVEEAALRSLQAVCESLGWDVGALWIVDRQAQVLRCLNVWHQPGIRVPEFEAACLELTFAIGMGLPGRVWQKRQAAWIPDVARDDNFPRAPVAAREGLHGAFGCPIMLGNDVRGVVEFFSRHIRAPDDDLLEMMATLGGQVGQFLERKQAEEALRRSEEELRLRVEQLADADRRKNEFLAMLGHELRNPLAPIAHAVHLLKVKGPADADLEQARDVIERQVQQLTRMVEDFLDVSRIVRGKITLDKKPVDVQAILTRAVETARPVIEGRSHQLTVSPPPDPVWVKADLTRLVQALTNLLINAAKYTDPGGRIWLSAERHDHELTIKVGDTGIGIAANVLPRIFEPFTQGDRALDRSQGGLGVGLTFVRGVVEMHGGSVQAFSPGPGKGSEFVVRLPAVTERDVAPATPSTAPEAAASRARRILVVDDNVDGAKTLALLLTLAGHEVNTAFDGAAALEAAHNLVPEVILLDIGLPGMDGYEVARRLREQPSMSKVLLVALTGYGQEEDRRRCLEAGFNAFLVKPVDLATLRSLLEHSEELPAMPAG